MNIETESADVFLMGSMSDWRKDYEDICAAAGVTSFNPQVANWTPADGLREARALADCKVVILVISTATECIGSLAESGWSALTAILGHKRIGILVELGDPAWASAHDGSQRARHLVIDHAVKAEDLSSSLYVAESHEDLQAWLKSVLFNA